MTDVAESMTINQPCSLYDSWVLDTLRQDFRRNRDPLARLVLTVFRFGQWTVARRTLPRRLCDLPYKVLNLLVIRLGTNSDLPRNVSCGPGLRLFHPYGLILHPGARLGANINIYHQVTIGRRDFTGEPIIDDEVTLGAGAVVLGPVVIGPRAKIAARATVLDDVPAGGTAFGPRAAVRGPTVPDRASPPAPRTAERLHRAGGGPD